mmetsp:Transcript_6150/g.11922  ORF Transcript_6150/g.11922 Transcript_6150/m.11922 type:complete len:147 (-) Transcript_6150:135-575(-)
MYKSRNAGSEIISDLLEMAQEHPGEELELDRPPDAYCFVMKYLNMGKVSGVTCVSELIKESKYLGLDELHYNLTMGNHFGWRCQKQLDLSNPIGHRSSKRMMPLTSNTDMMGHNSADNQHTYSGKVTLRGSPKTSESSFRQGGREP